MATVTTNSLPEEPRQVDDRVKHPLHSLGRTIRLYVTLQGIATLILYLGLCFWIGLVLDLGAFKALGIDWVQEMPLWLRQTIRALVAIGLVILLAIALRKVLSRFRSRALALVLERRFPEELGDRLITAVELADTNFSKKYNYSGPMIEATIREAVERVGRLPVRGVFDWARLRWLGLRAAILSLGIYLVVGIVYLISGQDGLGGFIVRFNNTASIWFERNVLLRNIYWPRQAYLELVNFPANGDLRVGRDAPPPALRVRATKWIVADDQADEGWRPMRWTDLASRIHGIEIAMPALPAGWGDWTLDHIELQLGRQETMPADTVLALRGMFEKLEELAASPRMARRIRQLKIPETVFVYYRGETIRSEQNLQKQADHEYSGVLSDLKESVRFTARGEDYYTPYKKITLVPPPGLTQLRRDEERPAYLYHWPPTGSEPATLKGQKQLFKDLPISLSGVTSQIDVPAGTNVVLRGETDKEMLMPGGLRLRAREASAPLKADTKQLTANTFEIRFENVTAKLDFDIQLIDTDRVQGARHISIRPIDDSPPDVDVVVEVIRKTNQGYLVTPMARIPMSGKIRDDHGLEKVEFSHLVISLDNQGSALARPIVSAFHFAPVTRGLDVAAPAYLAWLGALSKSVLDEANKPAAFLAVDSFLERKKNEQRPATPAELQQLLQGSPEKKLLRDMAFDPDLDVFDVERLRLGVSDPGQVQPRYRIRLAVSATDNNVETGPGVSQSKEKYTILVVSENELLSEIAKEEEALHVKLEDTVNKLKDARNKLEQVGAELPSLKAEEFSPMARRTEEIIESTIKGWDVSQEVYKDYSKILKELKVNRVHAKIIAKVDQNICEPLKDAINQEFPGSETASREFLKILEGKKNDPASLNAAKQSLDRLIARLIRILDAMGDIMTINKLIDQLVQIERAEQKAHEKFKGLTEKLQSNLLDDVFAPTPKPPDKPPEKKP